jgi:hypothetical protein
MTVVDPFGFLRANVVWLGSSRARVASVSVLHSVSRGSEAWWRVVSRVPFVTPPP